MKIFIQLLRSSYFSNYIQTELSGKVQKWKKHGKFRFLLFRTLSSEINWQKLIHNIKIYLYNLQKKFML